jgi:SAM-dependent methyltransferase
VSYADLTWRDPNRVKRWLQARRVDKALALLPAEARTVVDYGAGDAEVSARLVERRPEVEAIAFEPTPALLDEARVRGAGLDRLRLVASEAELPTGWADALLCLEVFEHLPPMETRAALVTADRVLKPGGVLIIGVPVEVGPPALAKGLFRRARRPNEFDAGWGGMLGATLGAPPRSRPVAEIAPGRPYHPHHLGFDHRRLVLEVDRRFRITGRTGSPLAALGPLNAELYITALKP